MKHKSKAEPAFHRLTIDLDKAEYAALKQLAEAAERSVSRQAKVMVLESINKARKQA